MERKRTKMVEAFHKTTKPIDKQEESAVASNDRVSTLFMVQEFFIGSWDDKWECADLFEAQVMEKKLLTEDRGRPIRVIKRTEEVC